MSAAHDEAWDIRITEPTHPVAAAIQQRASEAEARLAETREYLAAAEAALDEQAETIRCLEKRNRRVSADRAHLLDIAREEERDALTAAFCGGILAAALAVAVWVWVLPWIAGIVA